MLTNGLRITCTIAIMFLATTAKAGVLTFDFTGTVYASHRSPAGISADFGDTVEGSFSYDPYDTDINPSNGLAQTDNFAPFDFSAVVNGSTPVSISGPNARYILDPSVLFGFGYFDLVAGNFSNPNQPSVRLYFGELSPGLFTDDVFPTDLEVGSMISVGVIREGNEFLAFSIDTITPQAAVVPEPITCALWGSGLAIGGLIAARRRKRSTGKSET